MAIIRVTGYSRVSTKAEAQLTSIKNQPKHFIYTLARPEFRNYKAVKRFYCDYGITGTRLNRTDFLLMLEDAGLIVKTIESEAIPHPLYPDRKIRQVKYVVAVDPTKKPKFDEIWVKTTSRFARNINAYDILETLRLAKVYVYFMDLNLSTRNDSDMESIRKKLSDDMGYSEQLSRMSKLVQQQYEEENRINGCPFGYVYHRKKKHQLPYYTIDEKDGETVRKIYQYSIEGLGAKSISKRLASEGLLTPQGKPFATSTIQRILTNEKYMGLNTSGKYTQGTLFQKLANAKIREDYKERLRPSEGLPAIISPETFEAAQTARHSRRTEGPEGTLIGLKKPQHTFRNLLVCGLCGNNFRYDNNRGRGFYICATKVNNGYAACNCNNLFLYQLDAYLELLQKEEMHSIIQQDYENTIESLVKLVEFYLDRLKNPIVLEQNKTDLNALQIEKQRKEQARAVLLDMLLSGEIASSSNFVYREKIQQAEDEIKEIETKIKNLITPTQDIHKALKQLFDIIWKEIGLFEGKKQTYTQEEILSMLECIKIYGQTKNNSGGRPPQPIFIPIIKTTEEAKGLINAGYAQFNYRARLKELDEDGKEIIGKDRFRFQHKYLLGKGPFNKFTPDLGFENKSEMSQLKDYVQQLYQEYQNI